MAVRFLTSETTDMMKIADADGTARAGNADLSVCNSSSNIPAQPGSHELPKATDFCSRDGVLAVVCRDSESQHLPNRV